MDQFIKKKSANLKAYSVPFLVISAVFLMLGFIMIKQVQNHYFNQMEQLSLNLAKGYATSVSKALMADDIVNELLEDKVLTASEATALYAEITSNQELQALAQSLNVDEINIFDAQGLLMFSNTESLVGWQAYQGHPIHGFIHSQNTRFVENIRANVVTGIYYKYGYFKTSEGNVVQIGVLADKIQPFLNQFETNYLLEELLLDNKVEMVYFISNEFVVTHSTNPSYLYKAIDNPQVHDAINKNKYIGQRIALNEEEVYEVFSPVFVNHTKIGTISITQSLQETNRFIFEMSLLGLGALLLIYAAIVFALRGSYTKNKKLSSIAYFDTLTQLPNLEYLKLYVKDRYQTKYSSSLMMINVSNFRTINMMFGYEYGDEILKTITHKLLCHQEPTTKLFRFGADRFVIVIDKYRSKGHLHQHAQRICAEFEQPFTYDGVKKYLTVQVGIIENLNLYQNVDQLFKDALITLNYVSSQKICNIAFYDIRMQDHLRKEEILESELREIFEGHEQHRLFLNYQPIIDANSEEIIGFEALVRLNSKTFGFVQPSDFIRIAETSQLITDLGQLVLESACQFVTILASHGFHHVKVAVNISGIQILQDDFVEKTIEVIDACGCNNHNIMLEITESVVLENFDEINKKLKQLNDYNIEVALDDFGSGYSSLLRLGELNANVLKIDRRLINTIMVKDEKFLILDEIIGMAHKFKMKVVAEGVEHLSQKDYLIKHHCDYIQGFYYSEPVDDDQVLKLLRKSNK
jgi:diguanylate cyclase (GGDEF)-like protein